MGKPIDLFVSLRDVSRVTKSGEVKSKFALRITAPELKIDPDEIAQLKPVALAITAVLRDSLRHGKRPDGISLPPLSGNTLEWRKQEADLGARGGNASNWYKDPAFRSTVKRNYDRDYKSRLGTFTPKAGGGRGNVSGLLIESILTKPVRNGTGFITFVAGRRATPRPGQSQSAIETVFSGIRYWSDVAMKNPAIQTELRASLERAIISKKRKFSQAFFGALRSASGLAREISSLGET